MPLAELHSLVGLSQNIIKHGAVTLPPTQAGTFKAMLCSVEDLTAKHEVKTGGRTRDNLMGCFGIGVVMWLRATRKV